MKLGLLGNMNNNHFSLMRYMRDLGVDAYLLLYSDDGTGGGSHFVPESDTFEIEKWSPYIIQTNLPNRGLGILWKVFKRRELTELFGSYDYLIGNGIAPVYARFAGRTLDLFLPYAYGGEYIDITFREHTRKYIRGCLHKHLQIQSLRSSTRFIGVLDFTRGNLQFFKKYGIDGKLIPLGIPMVYNREDYDFSELASRKEVVAFINSVSDSFPVVFSHVAHKWKSIRGTFFDFKRNDILIEGFAEYLEMSKNEKAKLVLVDYGFDVQESIKLIDDLGISKYVYWLPKLARKEILALLKVVHIGAGELGGALWGGTGWEFMASGVPFFQNIGLSSREFEESTNRPCPDIFHAATREDISSILCDVERNPEIAIRKGENLKRWFDTYNGISEAKRILQIIQQ